MNPPLRISLDTTPEQRQRLVQLQAAFAEVCNALAPVVQQRHLWNRVTLHHLTYHNLREQFPQMGSQMVCNAIYAVCRAARMVYQHPASPFHLSRFADGKLPLLKFEPSCPVFFDRHTLSLKEGQLSMYTLDGRMRFQLLLRPEDETRFRQQKLREILLSRQPGDAFELVFMFAEDQEEEASVRLMPAAGANGEIPAYLKVEEQAAR